MCFFSLSYFGTSNTISLSTVITGFSTAISFIFIVLRPSPPMTTAAVSMPTTNVLINVISLFFSLATDCRFQALSLYYGKSQVFRLSWLVDFLPHTHSLLSSIINATLSIQRCQTLVLALDCVDYNRVPSFGTSCIRCLIETVSYRLWIRGPTVVLLDQQLQQVDNGVPMWSVVEELRCCLSKTSSILCWCLLLVWQDPWRIPRIENCEHILE